MYVLVVFGFNFILLHLLDMYVLGVLLIFFRALKFTFAIVKCNQHYFDFVFSAASF